MQKQQGWPQAWEYCQAKPVRALWRASQEVNWSWRQCIQELRHLQEKGHQATSETEKNRQKHLAWAREKNNWTVAQWSKVLFSDGSKFCPIDNLWGIVKRKMRDTRRNNAEDLKVATKATWASIYYTWAVSQADWLHATSHWCSNSCKSRPNQVLGA